VEGLDFGETFAPIAHLEAISILLAFAASKGLKLYQEMMEKEFQMSMMGELTFFVGTQVKQMKQGTFIHQAKYTKD
jgi:hypothetical protein